MNRTRTATACLKSVMAEQDSAFRSAVKAGYLHGTVEQALADLERGHTRFALETLRTAMRRYPMEGLGHA